MKKEVVGALLLGAAAPLSSVQVRVSANSEPILAYSHPGYPAATSF